MKIEVVSRLRKYKVKRPQSLYSALQTAAEVVGMDTPAGIAETAVSVVLVGEKRIRRLNKEFLNHDYVTDVIAFSYQSGSFPVPEEGDDILLGELFVCPRTADRRRRRYKTSLSYEILLYIVHGFLHLAGYEDYEDSQRERMKEAEERVMKKLAARYELNDLFISN